jgi:competence protein ComEA
MSLYRRLIVAVATLGLATSVFAADENATPTTTTTTTETTATAPTDTSASAAPTDSTEAKPEEAKTDTTTTTTTTTADKVDINKATVKELMKVKGLSAAKAKAIVTYRKKHGDFKSVDDLKDVKGFKKLSDKKFQELEDRLTAG